MTQWGGILGPQPPRDSLTGDTNSHTLYTLSHGVYNRTCSLQVQNISTVHLFVSYLFTIRLLYKHIRSCQCSSCWFFFFYCWCLNCLNLKFSHFVFIHNHSFFPSFLFSLSLILYLLRIHNYSMFYSHVHDS